MQDPDQETEADIAAKDRPDEFQASREARPSLAERLMNPESPATRKVRQPAATATPPDAIAESPAEPAPTALSRVASEKPPVPSPPNIARSAPLPRFTAPNLDGALGQARRYIQLRYLIFLSSLLVVFLLTIVVGGFFVISLLNGSDWQETGISGGVVAFLVLILLLLQYRPARSFGSAATQVARLEATRASMNKSIEFWDRFLDERQREHSLEAADIATAVTSMTAAARELMNTEIDLEMTNTRASASQPKAQEENSSSRPKTVIPDPRRY